MSASLRGGVGHALIIAACLALAACSSTPTENAALSERLALQEKVEGQLKDADAAMKAGNIDQGMALLDDAIKTDPSAKQPWLRKAQYHFEKRQYGQAITEAQEVLQRDVSDNTARSILAVSGLRVSAEALDQLRKANEVNGSARTEAESVAKIIREALGEPILVPPAAAGHTAEAKTAAKPVVRAAPAPRPAAAAVSPTPAPAAATAAATAPAPVAAKPAASPAPVAAAPAATAVRPVATNTNTGASATTTVSPAKPKTTAAPLPAAGNGRSNPFGALQ